MTVLSIAQSKKGKPIDLTKEQLFLALASEVPDGDKLVANPYKKWSDVDKTLPDVAITVYGPPPTSGTRDAFVELAMHEGCKSLRTSRRRRASWTRMGSTSSSRRSARRCVRTAPSSRPARTTI